MSVTVTDVKVQEVTTTCDSCGEVKHEVVTSALSKPLLQAAPKWSSGDRLSLPDGTTIHLDFCDSICWAAWHHGYRPGLRPDKATRDLLIATDQFVNEQVKGRCPEPIAEHPYTKIVAESPMA